jgi:hypothetical protein
VRRVLSIGIGHTTDEQEDQAEKVAAARAGGAPAPIEWELAHPGDPDVDDLSRRLLRAISTRIQHRAAIAAALARERDELAPNVSASTDSSLRRAA